MNVPAFAFALLASVTPVANATGTLTLALPHALAAHQALVLHVQVGAVPRGTTIRVERPDGTLIGLISPYAVVPGQEAGSYTVPLHDEDVKDGQVALRITVETSATTARPARGDEVKGVTLDYVTVGP